MANKLPPAQWMTVAAYAKRYRLTTNEVFDLIDTGKLPAKFAPASAPFRNMIRLVNAAATSIIMPRQLDPACLINHIAANCVGNVS